MKEFCGFEDSRGGLHRTKKQCQEAEINYRTNDLIRDLRNLEEYVASEIDQGIIGYNGRVSRGDMMVSVSKIILGNIDYMISIKRRSEECREQLNKLREEKETMRRPWYLQFKWW